MKILFVSRWYPYPPNNGSRIRIYNLIRHLAARHQIDLIAFCSEQVQDSQLAGLRPYCGKIWTTPYDPDRNGKLSKVLGYFSARPRSVVSSYSQELQNQVDAAERSGQYDLLISSQVDMAVYTQKWQASPKIFEELELTTLYEQAMAGESASRRLRDRLTWWKNICHLRKAMAGFQGCTVVSQQERERALASIPAAGPIEVVPNGVDVAYYRGDYGQRQPSTLIYSGSLTYFANLDAMQYFLADIFPRIKALRPDARLLITGSTNGLDLSTLPDVAGVELTGYVEDIRPVIARSQVSVVPLRIGGGTRLKILESLALGTPVVSTTKGAEGLGLSDRKDYIAADTPEDFANAILEVLDSPKLAERLSCQGMKTVESRYDWKIIGQKLDAFLEQTLMGSSV